MSKISIEFESFAISRPYSSSGVIQGSTLGTFLGVGFRSIGVTVNKQIIETAHQERNCIVYGKAFKGLMQRKNQYRFYSLI